jgi:hypothetical protein
MRKLNSDNAVKKTKAMKKVLFYTCALAAMLVSCHTEDADFVYHSRDNIYFGIGATVGLTEAEVIDKELLPEGMQDPRNMSYSFAVTLKPIDTIYVPVTISGQRAPMPRRFKVVANADSTTAQAGLHYKTFEDFYTIPADSGGMMLPVILLNRDTLMETQSFAIRLELVPTDDFEVTLPENYAKIVFSNRLERPDWWTFWEGQGQIGTYTRTKHALYLIALGDIKDKDLITGYNAESSLLLPYDLYLLGKFRALLFNPILWMTNNPGYVKTEVAPGVYEFYSVANEFTKYKMVYSDQDGRYYFVDENGKYVSTDY